MAYVHKVYSENLAALVFCKSFKRKYPTDSSLYFTNNYCYFNFIGQSPLLLRCLFVCLSVHVCHVLKGQM